MLQFEWSEAGAKYRSFYDCCCCCVGGPSGLRTYGCVWVCFCFCSDFAGRRDRDAVCVQGHR